MQSVLPALSGAELPFLQVKRRGAWKLAGGDEMSVRKMEAPYDLLKSISEGERSTASKVCKKTD